MHPHAHPIVGALVMACFFGGVVSAMFMAADMTELNKQIADALLTALRETGHTHKDIYLAMGYSKGQWSKVLSGEKTLSLVRLHLAPFGFFLAVWKRLIAIKAHDFALDARMDADLERQTQERRQRVA